MVPNTALAHTFCSSTKNPAHFDLTSKMCHFSFDRFKKNWLSSKCEPTNEEVQMHHLWELWPSSYCLYRASRTGGAGTLVIPYPGHLHCPRRDTFLNTALSSDKKIMRSYSVHQPAIQIQQNETFSLIKTTLAEIRNFSVYLRSWFLTIWHEHTSFLSKEGIERGRWQMSGAELSDILHWIIFQNNKVPKQTAHILCGNGCCSLVYGKDTELRLNSTI